MSRTFDTTNTGLKISLSDSIITTQCKFAHSSKTSCKLNFVESARTGNNNKGVMIIRDRMAMTTVFVSPGRVFFLPVAAVLDERFFILKISRTPSAKDNCDHVVLKLPLRGSCVDGSVPGPRAFESSGSGGL
jgi:hypothetical protein